MQTERSARMIEFFRSLAHIMIVKSTGGDTQLQETSIPVTVVKAP